MDHYWKNETNTISVDYRWKNPSWNTVSIKCSNIPEKVIEGSEEEFITEHYWGYSKLNNVKTNEYQVEHKKWEVYKTEALKVNVDFGINYGLEFSFLSTSEPASSFLAEGSSIIVRQGRRIIS